MSYQLYFDKEKCILEIKPLKGMFKNIEVTDEVEQYNHCHYFCNNKKSLKEKALELKQEWLNEAQDRLDKVMAINI